MVMDQTCRVKKVDVSSTFYWKLAEGPTLPVENFVNFFFENKKNFEKKNKKVWIFFDL